MALAPRRTAALLTLSLVAGALVATTGATAAVAADEPIAGGLSAGDSLVPTQGNSGYDALHYDIDLTVNVAVSSTSGAVATTTFPSATTTVRASTTGAPLSSYAFDFQGSTSTLAAATLNVNSVTVNGEPATFSRIETTTTANATTDVHKLVVTPSTPVDGIFTTVVKYSGTPVKHTDTDNSSEGWNATTDGATFVNQPVGAMTAFPNNNTPSDKATYTISVNAPSKLTTSATAAASNPGLRNAAVVSNGELISKTPSEDGTRTTWVWDQKKPMASMVSLISIGRYDVYESDITLASGRTLHEWSFIDPAISIANQNITQATRTQLKPILDFLETKYGPYPGGSVGLVTDVVPTSINYALETQDRSFFPNAADRGTTIHELTHQWFGDGISPRDWNDIWISEGTATYAEQQTAFEGAGSTTTATDQYYYNLWNTTATNNSLWTTPTAKMTLASQLFGSQVYTRGAMTLEALRTSIGSAKFAQLMSEWQSRYSGSSRSTANFIALAEEISGRSLTTFFTTWIFTAGKPAAWPSKFNLALAGPSAPLNAGDTGTFTVTTRNTGKVAQAGSVVTVDLAHVTDKATLGILPANTTLNGTTLTWTVPSAAVGATSTISFTATLNPETSGATLSATAAASTLGSTCVSCSSSLVVGSEPIATTAVPTITGTPSFGEVLTASTGEWSEGTAFTYQWLLDGTPIVGATSATYKLDGLASGFAVAVQVTGTNGSAAPVTRTSAATAAVVKGTLTAPTPTITGTPQFGKSLTANTDGWDAQFFTYQWAVNGTNITSGNGGTGASFRPYVATQLGQTVVVTVTGTKFGYTSVAKATVASAAIITGEFVSTPVPTITGTGRALSPLITNAVGSWDDGTTLAYQWSASGTPITGATAGSYTPTIAQVGSPLTVAVTGTKAGITTVTKTSEPIIVSPAAQVLAPTPVVTGTAQFGLELGVAPGTWDAGTALSYQWLIDGEPVEGATGAAFAPGASTVGHLVTVAVTSTRTGYLTVSKTSAAVTVASAPLELTPLPVISGDPKVDVELSAVPGTWDDDVALTFAWLADGAAIEGATTATFTPGAGHAGTTISVAVTGAKLGYTTTTVTSVATAAVELGDLATTPVPSVSGTPKVGVTLAAVTGIWDAGTAFAYQWSANGEEIEGAIESSYTPGPDRVGTVITVTVTGTKTGYTPVDVTSAATTVVAPANLVTTAVPTVSGTPKVGVLLTALAGTWDASTTFTYEWFANGSLIADATASEFTPAAAQAGKRISVAVTGSKPGYAPVTRTSAQTAVVAIGSLALAPAPAITGDVRTGGTIEASTGTWDTDTAFSYQWKRDGKAISKATSASYQLVVADYGHKLTVVVTGTKPGFVAVSKTSVARTVAAGEQVLAPVPLLRGSQKVGGTLYVTATYDAGVSKKYTWFANGKKLSTTTSTLKLTKSLKGKVIYVKVTATKKGYLTVIGRTGVSSKIS